MSGLSIDETQLRGPWESAQGFLIDTLTLLQAQLGPIFPLIDGIQSVTNASTGTIGLSGYPSNALLTTDASSTPGFTATIPLLAFNTASVTTPTPITASTNDYNPAGFAGAAVLRLSASGPVNVTGIKSVGNNGFKLLVNTGASTITLTHADTNSTLQNRFRCPGAVNFALTTSMSKWIWYDVVGAVWQVVG